MSDERGSRDNRPSQAQVFTGIFLALVGVLFFALSGLDQALFGVDIDLDNPAYILLGVGLWLAFGLKLADFLDRRS